MECPPPHAFFIFKCLFRHTRTHTLKYRCHWSGNPSCNCLIDLLSPSLLHFPLTFWKTWLVLSLLASGDWSNNCHSGTKLPWHVCCLTSGKGFIIKAFGIKGMMESVFALVNKQAPSNKNSPTPVLFYHHNHSYYKLINIVSVTSKYLLNCGWE